MSFILDFSFPFCKAEETKKVSTGSHYQKLRDYFKEYSIKNADGKKVLQLYLDPQRDAKLNQRY